MDRIIFERVDDTKAAPLPKLATPGSACYDLVAAEQAFIPPRGTKVVSTGLKVQLPSGYVGLVCSRSGLAAKHRVFVLNAPGVIDSDYRGELKVILASLDGAYMVEAGDRIAQLMVIPATTLPVFLGVVQDNTDRGSGGFGSTGS
jgi:dUTP pyrophosphatase